MGIDELIWQIVMVMFEVRCELRLSEEDADRLSRSTLAEREAYWMEIGGDCMHFALRVYQGMCDEIMGGD